MDRKKVSKKVKLFSFLSVAGISILGLSIGLGVGLSQTTTKEKPNIKNHLNVSFQSKRQVKVEMLSEKENYSIYNESINSNEPKKVLRIDKTANLEMLTSLQTKLQNEPQINNLEEILVPYKIDEELHLEHWNEDGSGHVHHHTNIEIQQIVRSRLGLNSTLNKSIKVNFVLYKENYKKDKEYYDNGGYVGEPTRGDGGTIVEVEFPKDLKKIIAGQFSFNEISRTNLNELTQLEEIGDHAFRRNSLEELDLSNLTSLKTIGSEAFSRNILKGELILPPNIEIIKKGAFGYEPTEKNEEINQISGTLVIPYSLKSIGENAFLNNRIEKVDYSNANKSLKVAPNAFVEAN